MSEKAEKGKVPTIITATTSSHLPKPVLTDLTIKPDSVLINPIGKDGVRGWSMQNIYPIRHFFVTPSLEGRPTKDKEAPSPHKVRLAPLDTNPVF